MDIPISPAAFRPQSWNPGPERSISHVFFGPDDDEKIFQRNERLHQITRVMERLSRVEKQYQKIMVLIYALTMTAFIFLLMNSALFPQMGR